MQQSYHVGEGTNSIKFKLDVGTFGLARSRALVTDEGRTAIFWTDVSQDATGDIPSKIIGIQSSLDGKLLLVGTEISLVIITDPEERKKEVERLTATTFLSGGAGGDQQYVLFEKIYNEERQKVILTQLIRLI